MKSDLCPCGSLNLFSECCQPLIQSKRPANTAEALMRSRFTAYATQDYHYVLQTYAESKRATLTVEELANAAQDTTWLSLDVVSANTESVEFIAVYQASGAFGKLHERSRFVREAGNWRYFDGHLFDDSGPFTPGRNDPCPCGSGKKFKKCCH